MVYAFSRETVRRTNSDSEPRPLSPALSVNAHHISAALLHRHAQDLPVSCARSLRTCSLSEGSLFSTMS